MKQTRQIAVRIDADLVAGLDVLYERTRINKTAAVHMALQDLLAKFGINAEQPKVD